MNSLSAYADELSSLVDDGRRIRLGDRNFEKPHADLDALLDQMRQLATRMRAEVPVMMPAVRVTDMRANGEVVVLPASPVTGQGQFIVCRTRGPRR